MESVTHIIEDDLTLMITACHELHNDFTQYKAIQDLEKLYNYTGLLTVLFDDLLYTTPSDLLDTPIEKKGVLDAIEEIDKKLQSYGFIKYGKIKSLNLAAAVGAVKAAVEAGESVDVIVKDYMEQLSEPDDYDNVLELTTIPDLNTKLWVFSSLYTYLPAVNESSSGAELEMSLKLHTECLCKTQVIYGLYQHITLQEEQSDDPDFPVVVWTNTLDISGVNTFIKNLPIDQLYLIPADMAVITLGEFNKDIESFIEGRNIRRLKELTAQDTPIKNPIIMWAASNSTLVNSQVVEVLIILLNSPYYQRSIKYRGFDYEQITTLCKFIQLYNSNIQLALMLYKTLITFTRQLYETQKGVESSIHNKSFTDLSQFIARFQKDGVKLDEPEDFHQIPNFKRFQEDLYTSPIFIYFASQLQEIFFELHDNLTKLHLGLKTIKLKFTDLDTNMELLNTFTTTDWFLQYIQNISLLNPGKLAISTSSPEGALGILNTCINMTNVLNAQNFYTIFSGLYVNLDQYTSNLEKVFSNVMGVSPVTTLKIIPLDIKKFSELLANTKSDTFLDHALKDTIMHNGWLQIHSSITTDKKHLNVLHLQHVINQQLTTLKEAQETIMQLKTTQPPSEIVVQLQTELESITKQFQKVSKFADKLKGQNRQLREENTSLEKTNKELAKMKSAFTTVEQYRLGLGLHA